jgi:hypothetical protein
MGQRTQALVRFNNIDKNGNTTEVAAFSIHYQWGYGSLMLLDLLGLSRSASSQMWAYDAPSPQDFIDTMLAASIGGIRNLSGMGIDNHQTMNDVITYSDNDNGYAELTITAKNHDMTATLKLFDSAGGHVTLAEYMRKSASLNETPKFVNAYKVMLDCMGIELIEPAE